MSEKIIIITGAITCNDLFVEGVAYYYAGLLKFQKMDVALFNIAKLPPNATVLSLKTNAYFKAMHSAFITHYRSVFILPECGNLLPTILKIYTQACVVPTIIPNNRHYALVRIGTKVKKGESIPGYNYPVEDFITFLGKQVHPLRLKIPYVEYEPMKMLLSNNEYVTAIAQQVDFLKNTHVHRS